MAISTATRLSVPQQQQFDRDGYLFPLRVLDDGEVAAAMGHYRDYVARNQARLDALPANQKYHVFSETHFAMRWAYDLVIHPRVLDAVESILGPNILAWNTTWFSKMPGDKLYVSWHQDGTYWNLRPPTVVTAWVALSPSVSTNGCMRVVPGTHKQPSLPQRETYAKDNALSRGQEIAVQVDEAHAVDLQLQPGEMSLHHIWIVHGSNANTGNVPRIGLAIRYVRPEVVQDSPARPMAMLVRGKDEHGNFELLPAPSGDTVPSEAQATHRAIVDRIRAGIMKDAGAAR